MFVASIFLSSHGSTMSKLKDILDSGGEYHTLQLIWGDVWYTPVRSRILSKISEEAKYIKNRAEFSPQIKVIADVDDTLICSGGRWPAGLDKQIPRGCTYPGSLQFFAAIAERAKIRLAGASLKAKDDYFPSTFDSESEASEPPSPSLSGPTSPPDDLFFSTNSVLDESDSKCGAAKIKGRKSITSSQRASSAEEIVVTTHSGFPKVERSKSDLSLVGKSGSGPFVARKKTLTYAKVAAAFRNASKSGALGVSADTPTPTSREKKVLGSSGPSRDDTDADSVLSASPKGYIERCSLYFVTARPAYNAIGIEVLNLFASMADQLLHTR